MNDTNRHPNIDYMALQKGDVIGIEELEKITHKQVGTDAYDLAVMGIRKRILDEREDLTVVHDHDTLRILTDPEASTYNDTRFKRSIRVMCESNNRLIQVDTSQFNKELSDKHLRRIELNSRTYQAAMLGRRGKLTLPPVTRKTPGLLTEKT